MLYADIDEFDPTKHSLKRENLTAMDRWVLSRLNTVIKTVDSLLESLKITEAGRELTAFVDELSNWYVRRCRERYWGKDMTDDKEAAYMTLYTVLDTLSKVIAPFVPFMSEAMYQNITRTVDTSAPESVHLCAYPVCNETLIDRELEAYMGKVLDIVVLGRSARNTANIKNRQPIGEMFVQGAQLPAMYVDIIASELNVKKVTFVTDASSFVTYRVKPQLKTLGPRYGKILPKISAYLAGEGVGNDIVAAHGRGESYEFDVEGTHIVLSKDDVLVDVQKCEGYVTETMNDLAVVLNTTLTDELVDEGFVREIVSKLQTMRKEAGFEVVDHIEVSYDGSDRINSIFERFGGNIASDTLADSVKHGIGGTYTKDWSINGENVTLSVRTVD